MGNINLLHLSQLPAGVLVVAQVLFIPHQDDGDIRAEVFHLWSPLLWDVLYTREGERREGNKGRRTQNISSSGGDPNRNMAFLQHKTSCFFSMVYV